MKETRQAGDAAMATKAVTREDGVLKLVHLGGFVELYWEPITAHDVMEKNPNHSVTRPDFWRYPWIVIQHDSVLKPGRVFYIIPNHVIHDLVKAYKLRNQIFSLKHRYQIPKQQPPIESGAKVNPIHRDHGLHYHLKHPVEAALAKITTTNKQVQVADRHVEMNLDQKPPIRHLLRKIRSWSRSKTMTDTTDQEHDQFLKRFHIDSCFEMVPNHDINDHQGSKRLSPHSSSWVESWLELTTKQHHHRQESQDDSWLEVRPPNTYDFGYDSGRCGNEIPCGDEIPIKQDQVKYNSQVQVKKSCLRSQSAIFDRKSSSGRRVTFDLPGKEKMESRSEGF